MLTLSNALQFGLHPAIQMHTARRETFWYRGMHKRIIDFDVLDPERWAQKAGPCVYAVFDISGRLRYVGKHIAQTPLRSRWVRHGHLHHQQASRTAYLEHLDGQQGALQVHVGHGDSLRRALPGAQRLACDRQLATAVEALWIDRHFGRIWNQRREPLQPGFSDGMTSAARLAAAQPQ